MTSSGLLMAAINSIVEKTTQVLLHSHGDIGSNVWSRNGTSSLNNAQRQYRY